MQGRQVWIVITVDGISWIDSTTVDSVKSIHLVGPVAYGDPSSAGGYREKDLVQLRCNPGGVRTLNAANVFMKEAQARTAMNAA